MATLTKDDIHAIRKADDICIHLNARNPEGLVRLIKRKPYNAKPFDCDQEHVLPATVRMATRVTAECFAMTNAKFESSGVGSILKTLRAGDELRFQFWPDAQGNQYTKDAGLYADSVYLDVIRDGKRVARWDIDSSITPDNSARMCRNIRPA